MLLGLGSALGCLRRTARTFASLAGPCHSRKPISCHRSGNWTCVPSSCSSGRCGCHSWACFCWSPSVTGGIGWQAGHAPEAPTYSRVVQFTFDGVEDGRYPNGTPFHIGDLVTPKLISALYDLHGLAERGVARAAFGSAFAIEPYSPERGYILRRREQLANRGTPTELVVLQEQLSAELRRAESGAARLSFRSLAPLPLSEGDVGKLLLDLPRLWAKKATEQYGVFGPDVPVYSPALFDLAEIEQSEYIAALEAIRRKATMFLEGARTLMRMPHGNAVRDSDTGAGLLEVQDAVHGLMDRVRRLSAEVVQLGLAKDRPALTRQYENRVAGLTEAAAVASDRVSTLQAALVELVGSSQDRSGGPAGEQATDALQQPGSVGALVDALLQREADVAQFKMELIQDRAMLAALKRQGAAEVEELSPPMDVRLAQIVTALREQAAVVQRIHGLLSRDNFAVEGGLYHVADGGLTVGRPPTLRPRDVYVYILLLFRGGRRPW